VLAANQASSGPAASQASAAPPASQSTTLSADTDAAFQDAVTAWAKTNTARVIRWGTAPLGATGGGHASRFAFLCTTDPDQDDFLAGFAVGVGTKVTWGTFADFKHGSFCAGAPQSLPAPLPWENATDDSIPTSSGVTGESVQMALGVRGGGPVLVRQSGFTDFYTPGLYSFTVDFDGLTDDIEPENKRQGHVPGKSHAALIPLFKGPVPAGLPPTANVTLAGHPTAQLTVTATDLGDGTARFHVHVAGGASSSGEAHVWRIDEGDPRDSDTPRELKVSWAGATPSASWILPAGSTQPLPAVTGSSADFDVTLPLGTRQALGGFLGEPVYPGVTFTWVDASGEVGTSQLNPVEPMSLSMPFSVGDTLWYPPFGDVFPASFGAGGDGLSE
jgi:hypothetical protein